MPKVRKEDLSKTSKRNSYSSDQKINIPHEAINPSWAGLLNAQGLPALPIPPSVDINLVMALAQVMTMNALTALSQNQSIPQNNIKDEKIQKRELMISLQEKLKNRKSNPPPPIIKKKKVKKGKSGHPSSSESPSNLSNLELLALATTAHQASDSSPETSNHRGSFSSPGLLTALQEGFPSIDWTKFGPVASPSQEALQSLLTNVSESQKQT
jgi:hypothetical protein